MTDKTRSETLLSGLDQNGKPFALQRGAIAVLHVLHDAGCPGGRGQPDKCNCKPEMRMGPLDHATLSDIARQARRA